MSVIEEARSALDVDRVRITQVAKKRGLYAQAIVEKLAYRRAVLDRGGAAAAQMASTILNRRVKGVKGLAAVAASIGGAR